MTSWYVNPSCCPNVNLVSDPSGKLSMLSAAAEGAARVLLTLLFLESLTTENSSEASDEGGPRRVRDTGVL